MDHQDPFGLNGKVVVVTGAASGIGRGIALKLADAGAQVAILDRAADASRGVADEIGAMGGDGGEAEADGEGLCGAEGAVVAQGVAHGEHVTVEHGSGFLPGFGRVDVGAVGEVGVIEVQGVGSLKVQVFSFKVDFSGRKEGGVAWCLDGGE